MADSGRPSDGVHEVAFDRRAGDPTVAVGETVADLSGREVDELRPLYDCVDHLLEHLYSDPPSPSADVEIAFSYEGYRITMYQDGRATFRRLD